MENKQFYIKYLTNGPVGLKTHILNTNTFEWVQTVFTVGDLVAAYRPNSLLANTPLELLTLHLPDDVARSALSEDCFASIDTTDKTLDPGCPLSILGSLGTKSKEPLIIKSKNDAGQGIAHGLIVGNEMEVDSSPTSTNSSKSSVNIKNDGIDIDTEHLERSELVQKLINMVHSNPNFFKNSLDRDIIRSRKSFTRLYQIQAIWEYNLHL